jgi:hypothetical protein
MTEVLGYSLPFLQKPDLVWSPFRGRERPDYVLDGNTSNICRHWAGISTGTHNQDVSMMLEGPKGTGKSYGGVTLCVNSAKWEAEILGTDWRDHFTIERNAAIIDTEKADEVMINSEKFDVRLFDDISLAWGNRNWQSDENKDKNDIFIINRIDNTINVLTSPNSKLIDVVPRSNVNFKGEMDTPYFNFGYTSMKIFKPIPIFRATGYKVLDPYLRAGRDKFVMYMIQAPPKRLIDEYNKERTRATEAIKKLRRDRLNERKGGEPAASVKQVQRKKNNKVMEMEERISKYEQRWKDIRIAGGGDKGIRDDAIDTLKIPLDTWRAWRRKGILHERGILQDPIQKKPTKKHGG